MDTGNARPRTDLTLAAIGIAALLSSGCLVLTLHPVYDDGSIAWDDALLGEWRDAEDNAQVTVTRAEWRSYHVRFVRPSETAEFTGYLTEIGNEHFLDLMPERGEDYGPVLVPVHLVLKVKRRGERWEVATFDYEALRREALAGRRIGGGVAALDQKHNVLLTGSSAELREWLRAHGARAFGAATVFEPKN
jgi:hypothetical protein